MSNQNVTILTVSQIAEGLLDPSATGVELWYTK